jgi:hypothetical protein
MASTLQRAVDGDLFRPAREQFEQMVLWLTSPGAPVEHSGLEDGISERGQEVMRLLYQGHLNQLSARERKEATEPEEGVAVRPRSRQLESKFGRVRLRRLGHKSAGGRVRYPLDERLNLPADLYSHPVRRRMAREAQRGSWQQAIQNVGETTAAHVPKRQAEEITVRAAQDFDTFYAERANAANDTVSKDAVQALSCDSTGITMRPESLRDATRKQAQAAAETEVRGDPMGDRKLRKHDKRMAVVTAVWEQERQVRTARQIVDNLQRRRAQSRQRDKKDKPPKPALSTSISRHPVCDTARILLTTKCLVDCSVSISANESQVLEFKYTTPFPPPSVFSCDCVNTASTDQAVAPFVGFAAGPSAPCARR